MKIRKGDRVKIIKGKDRGKVSKVEKVLPREDKVVVEGVNVYKKHLKPGRVSQEGGIIDITKPIFASNVMLVCSKCEEPTRIGYKFAKTGPRSTKSRKIRFCRKCSAEFN